jgi:hypothetical protein
MTDAVGVAVGTGVGVGVGTGVGVGVGDAVGDGLGAGVGVGAGEAVGDGLGVGEAVASVVGVAVGAGDAVGATEAFGDGAVEAATVGAVDGSTWAVVAEFCGRLEFEPPPEQALTTATQPVIARRLSLDCRTLPPKKNADASKVRGAGGLLHGANEWRCKDFRAAAQQRSS